MDITQLNPLLLASIPVILGVVSLIKGLGLPSRFAPLASVILGLGVSFLIGGTPFIVIMGGLIVGLSASGLYSGTKATIEG